MKEKTYSIQLTQEEINQLLIAIDEEKYLFNHSIEVTDGKPEFRDMAAAWRNQINSYDSLYKKIAEASHEQL